MTLPDHIHPEYYTPDFYWAFVEPLERAWDHLKSDLAALWRYLWLSLLGIWMLLVVTFG